MMNEYDEYDDDYDKSYNDNYSFPLWPARAQSCQYQIRVRSRQWGGTLFIHTIVCLCLKCFGHMAPWTCFPFFVFPKTNCFHFPLDSWTRQYWLVKIVGFKGFTRRMYSHSAHYSSHLHRYQGGNKSTVFASRQIPPKLWLIAQFIVPLCVLWLPTDCTFSNLMMSTLALLFDKPMHHICHFFHADACCGSERDKSKRTPLVEFCQL